jgi:hypothetical protein
MLRSENNLRLIIAICVEEFHDIHILFYGKTIDLGAKKAGLSNDIPAYYCSADIT